MQSLDFSSKIGFKCEMFFKSMVAYQFQGNTLFFLFSKREFKNTKSVRLVEFENKEFNENLRDNDIIKELFNIFFSKIGSDFKIGF